MHHLYTISVSLFPPSNKTVISEEPEVSRAHQVASRRHLTPNFHPPWSRKMIVTGTTAHPRTTQMAGMGHALIAFLPTAHCYDSYDPMITGLYVQTLASIPTFSLLCSISLHENQQHSSLLAWHYRKAPRTAPRIQTFPDVCLTSLVPGESNVLAILLPEEETTLSIMPH